MNTDETQIVSREEREGGESKFYFAFPRNLRAIDKCFYLCSICVSSVAK